MLIVHSPVVGLNLPPISGQIMLQPGGVRKAQKPLSAKKSLIISPDVIKKCYPQKIIDNQYRCPVFDVFDFFNVFVSFKE